MHEVDVSCQDKCPVDVYPPKWRESPTVCLQIP